MKFIKKGEAEYVCMLLLDYLSHFCYLTITMSPKPGTILLEVWPILSTSFALHWSFNRLPYSSLSSDLSQSPAVSNSTEPNELLELGLPWWASSRNSQALPKYKWNLKYSMRESQLYIILKLFKSPGLNVYICLPKASRSTALECKLTGVPIAIQHQLLSTTA